MYNSCKSAALTSIYFVAAKSLQVSVILTEKGGGGGAVDYGFLPNT